MYKLEDILGGVTLCAFFYGMYWLLTLAHVAIQGQV